MADFPEYPKIQDYLFSLKAKGVRFGIDRMASWMDALGNPDRRLPLVHVAGTNGKGSVSAMLESVFRCHGLRTGLYTSPHLVRLGERVQVNREILTEPEIISFTKRLRPLAEAVSASCPDDHPSFFEFMTAMAFLKFAESGCDVGIIEVGMGGRLDATNVITPAVSVITSIGLDHCEFLGDTFEKIAAEKAGIIKPGVPVVMGLLPPEAEAVVKARAAELGCRLFSVRETFGERPEAFPNTSLTGDYQRCNAATAVLTLRALESRWPVSAATIERGLTTVAWPGRWERRRIGERDVIFDASHNPEGAEVLDRCLRALKARESRRLIVVTGVLGAARAGPLLRVVAAHADVIHLVVPKQARSCSFSELRALIPTGFSGAVHESAVETLFPKAKTIAVGNPEDLLVVTGSIYLLGEVLSRLEPERGENESRLQDF